jgi:hypothetical protein
MRLTTLPRTLSRLLLTLTASLLTLSLMTSPGWTQTTCAEPDRCMSRARVDALVDAACSRSRAAEARLPTVIDDLAAVQTQRDVCLGRLAQVQEAPPVPWRSPWWLRVGLDVALVGVGVGTGAVAGIGGPPEVIVGGVVLEVAMLGGRLMLEWLDGRRPSR